MASSRRSRGASGRRPRRARTWGAVVATVAFLAASAGVSAQSSPEYLDPGAALLHRAATEHHFSQAHRLTGYEATFRQRIGVRLRLPFKDRTLYHAESVHRVLWRREGPVTVAPLGIRETTPSGPEEEIDYGLVDEFWDPARDRLLLGAREPGEEDDPEDFSIEHPLEPEGAAAYRFASGDTITLALPDGRRVRAIELRMTPRVRAPSRLVGSLWIEPESGALVRATYRMSETLDALRDIEDLREENARGEFRWIPGLFKPWTFDATLVTIDYFLWEGDVWLPLRWRAEGVVRAGVLEAPGELDRSFRFSWIGTETPGADPAASPERTLELDGYRPLEGDGRRRRNGRDVVLLVPEDPERLRRGPELPPPVWEDAPGFVSRAEIDFLVDRLDEVPTAPAASLPWRFAWGFQQAGLVRYNRVEELSVGARGTIVPDVGGRPLSAVGTVRIGTGDVHPNARLDVTRSSLRRSLSLSVYHELAATEGGGRPLGLGSSAMALLFGRDDGDYYRTTGGALVLGPPPHRRPSWSLALTSERHEPVRSHTRASLARLWEDGGWAFRPDLAAEEGWEHALTLRLERATASDPTRAQAGLSWTGTAAAGSLGHVRTTLAGRLLLPVGTGFRLGVTAWGGAASSDVPAQRAIAVGGPATLRGYAPRTRVG